ncbi:hypothetical protein QR680_010692 [Steinernema hermaphroditum]|uniref:Uncharacterized protein n=1 Tax=Steinernema hermaphroditum TaxID=289476 RepID=A0AA39IPT7_9BILA|nr:hypothetical protein QR680_010692 [Steinernema hermaphroditum]
MIFLSIFALSLILPPSTPCKYTQIVYISKWSVDTYSFEWVQNENSTTYYNLQSGRSIKVESHNFSLYWESGELSVPEMPGSVTTFEPNPYYYGDCTWEKVKLTEYSYMIKTDYERNGLIPKAHQNYTRFPNDDIELHLKCWDYKPFTCKHAHVDVVNHLVPDLSYSFNWVDTQNFTTYYNLKSSESFSFSVYLEDQGHQLDYYNFTVNTNLTIHEENVAKRRIYFLNSAFTPHYCSFILVKYWISDTTYSLSYYCRFPIFTFPANPNHCISMNSSDITLNFHCWNDEEPDCNGSSHTTEVLPSSTSPIMTTTTTTPENGDRLPTIETTTSSSASPTTTVPEYNGLYTIEMTTSSSASPITPTLDAPTNQLPENVTYDDADPTLKNLTSTPITTHSVHSILNDSLPFAKKGEMLNPDDLTCLSLIIHKSAILKELSHPVSCVNLQWPENSYSLDWVQSENMTRYYNYRSSRTLTIMSSNGQSFFWSNDSFVDVPEIPGSMTLFSINSISYQLIWEKIKLTEYSYILKTPFERGGLIPTADRHFVRYRDIEFYVFCSDTNWPLACKYAYVEVVDQAVPKWSYSFNWIDTHYFTAYYNLTSNEPFQVMMLLNGLDRPNLYYIFGLNESLIIYEESLARRAVVFYRPEELVQSLFYDLDKSWINKTNYALRFGRTGTAIIPNANQCISMTELNKTTNFHCWNDEEPECRSSNSEGTPYPGSHTIAVTDTPKYENVTFDDADPGLKNLSSIPITTHNVHSILNDSLPYSQKGKMLNPDDVTCLSLIVRNSATLKELDHPVSCDNGLVLWE